MKRRNMFLRMITASLVRRRSRMLVALLAIAIGATILSGLVTIYYDVPRQMGAQFRSYGANMIFTRTPDSGHFTLDDVRQGADRIADDELVGLAPYRYESVLINDRPVIAAGTDLEGAKRTSPYWLVNGEWPDAAGEVLIGKAVAGTYRLNEGDAMTVQYNPEPTPEAPEPEAITTEFTVTGILDTGGTEEEYIFMSLKDLEAVTGEAADLDVAELSVSASAQALQAYAEQIAQAVPGVTPRLVKRVTQSESTVLTKLQALVLLVTIIVLL